MLVTSFGGWLKRGRELRELTVADAARAAGISAAYLSKLENDYVKKPSPPILLQLSEAIGVPYAELMRLSGYRVPGVTKVVEAVGAALFADISDDEREELLDYLAWYRARRKSKRGAPALGQQPI